MLTADEVVAMLRLKVHPIEGGWFRETQRTAGALPGGTLADYPAERSLGTSIYFLLSENTVSEMHRLPGDEIFHFYLGDPMEMLQLHPDGASRVVVLGSDLRAGQEPQLTVPGGVWQGSRPLAGMHGYTLLGCTMAPGFDYADYVRGKRAELAAAWSCPTELLEALTPHG